MKTAIEVLDAFENIRRAQRAGVYAPHKPLLILLALARVQRGEPRATLNKASNSNLYSPCCFPGTSFALRECAFHSIGANYNPRQA